MPVLASPPRLAGPIAAMLALLVPALASALLRGPVPPALANPGCGTMELQGAITDTLVMAGGAGVWQPMPITDNIQDVQTRVNAAGWGAAVFSLVEWDPVALAPDPTALAIRSRSFDASAVVNGVISMALTRPAVVRAFDHVADPPRRTLAWTWYRPPYSYYVDHGIPYDRNSTSGWPAAISTGNPGAPLAGSHPVMVSDVCLGDAGLQSLRVAQAVGHADANYDLAWNGFAQRFGVPQATRVRWVEFVRGPDNAFPSVPGTLAILDAEGQAQPPATTSGALVQAAFSTSPAGYTQWMSHVDFDATITLEPNHDYWLMIVPDHQMALRLHTVTGMEGPDFAAGIADCWARRESADPWLQQDVRALAFRLIGEPVDAATAPPLRVAPLALRVSPNPVAGEALVECSGATGRVHLEMLDVRGRRVDGADLDAAAATRWRWRAIDANGAPLPAGAYFVRAVDSAGHAGQQRVVLVR